MEPRIEIAGQQPPVPNQPQGVPIDVFIKTSFAQLENGLLQIRKIELQMTEVLKPLQELFKNIQFTTGPVGQSPMELPK